MSADVVSLLPSAISRQRSDMLTSKRCIIRCNVLFAPAYQLLLHYKFRYCILVATFVVSNTNPNVGALVRQWLYTIPLAALFLKCPFRLKRVSA
jgi:hypothetical protein